MAFFACRKATKAPGPQAKVLAKSLLSSILLYWLLSSLLFACPAPMAVWIENLNLYVGLDLCMHTAYTT